MQKAFSRITLFFKRLFARESFRTLSYLKRYKKKETSSQSEERKKLYLEIEGMWCPSCAELIYLLLMQNEGIVKCKVDYATDLAMVEYFPRKISKETVLAAVKKCGYLPRELENSDHKVHSFSLSLRLIVALFCALNVMMFSYPIYASYFDSYDLKYGTFFSYLSLILSLPVLTYCAFPIYRRFFYTLKWGLMGMETLITLATLSAFGVSIYSLLHGGQEIYFDTFTVIIALVLLGKMIETRAKWSAKDALLWIHRSVPKRGRKKFANGDLGFVSLKEFELNDQLVVFRGERIALDGLVIDGAGTCDESILTGEPMPIVKRMGDTVLSGSILQNGKLIIETKTQAQSSTLHTLIGMIENDVSHKEKYSSYIDTLTRYFVPFVLFLASLSSCFVYFSLVTEPFQEATIRFFSVLLIACPCAIGIASPLLRPI